MNSVITPSDSSREKFIQLLVERFPSLKSEVLDESRSDLIYSQVSCLTDYANNCLQNGLVGEFEKAIALFYQTVGKVDSTTEDALFLNFLGDLEMDGDTPDYQSARALLQSEHLHFWAEWRARHFGEKHLINYLTKP
jgi:hypothetical protein